MYLKCIASLLHLKCFLLTNNADRSELKANDFYPRNDSYLPLVGDTILVVILLCMFDVLYCVSVVYAQ